MLIPSPYIIMTGLLIGMVTAAPVGPVNVLCIQRTLERGFFAGLASGMGAMLGDGLIALVAAFGINAISDVMLQNKALFQIVGGAILLIFGIKLYSTPPKLSAEGGVHVDDQNQGLLDYLWSIPQTFFLTITNPGAVLGMFALVGGAGSALGGLNSTTEAFTLVLSVMGGSLLWWFSIARIISTFRHRLNEQRLRAINQVAGIILGLFGLAVMGQLALKAV
jgi:threonine/homoserine/homoserine lactone efflux protein